MSASFSSLEIKIDAVLALCEQLREENRALRAQQAASEANNQALTQTIEATRVRLEALMHRLPEEE